MILLFDIGNTNTHVGLANEDRVMRAKDFPTREVQSRDGCEAVRQWLGKARIEGACLGSVVPSATAPLQRWITQFVGEPAVQPEPGNLPGLGLDYPTPETIGQDRLANAVAARHYFGAPVVAIGFGTAAVFDVVDRRAKYIGGIIAPGLALMTSYLHEKTAQLPLILLREPRGVVGRNTEQAMLVGAVHGYRGLVRELITGLRHELGARQFPIVATGGYARFVAARLPEISDVRPHLTLEGLRLIWLARRRGS